MKFSAKLSILLLSITVSVVAVVSFVAYTLSHKALKKEIRHEMQSYAVGTLDTIDRTLFERIADMKVMSTDSIISSPESTPKQINTRLIEYRNEHKTYTSLSFFDLNRIRIADTSGMEIGKQHKSTLYFQNALDKEFCFNIAMSESLKIPVIHFTMLVKDKNGEAFGLVVARMPLSKLHDMITPKLAGRTHHNQRTLEGLEIDLIDAEGLLLYSNYNRKGILKDNLLEHKEFKAILAADEEVIITIRDPLEGDTDFCVHAHEHGHLDFPGSGWVMIVRVPVEVAFAPVIQMRNAMAAISIAIVVIAIAASLIFSRTISKPITKLRNAAVEIGRGDLDTRIEIKSKDEIGQLSRAFDKMTVDLKETTTSIENLNKEITDRKEAEKTLEFAYAELEKANTKLKETQSQLVQNEKLASIGQLAAGIAHEINTPVGFVASNFQTLESYIDKIEKLLKMYDKLIVEIEASGKTELLNQTHAIAKSRGDMKIDFILEDIPELFSDSKEGVTRVTNIVQNLRDFSRIDMPGSLDEYNINDGIESTLVVAKNEIKYDANVKTDFSEVPLILCHAGQINQVFLNVFINAAQAIKSRHRDDMGTITIKTYATDDQVACEISDNGGGIAPENLSKIFDPFFTTKPTGKGTGLGLSVSHDIIVHKHNGQLLVDSTVGEGTTFTIKLPIEKQNLTTEEEIINDGKKNGIICG